MISGCRACRARPTRLDSQAGETVKELFNKTVIYYI
jgi:hypothetical protein